MKPSRGPSRSPLGAGEVRLIGGRFKRSKLPVLAKDGLRPTPDRVRETLFNWLGQDLSGWQVLDAFAGSGALGFEAASRGAARVVMLEHDPQVAQQLQRNQERLQATAVEVLRTDALAWMRQPAGAPRFHLVFLDPPFGRDWQAPALELASHLLAPGAWVYVESPAQCSTGPAGLELHRHLQAGAVHAHLFKAPAP